MPPEEKSSLDRLQEKLYSPNQEVSFSEPAVHVQAPQAPAQQWTQPPSFTAPPPKPPRKHMSIAVWFLICALLFALIAAGASAYFLLMGGRSVSSNKIDITVTVGQTTVASGTAVPLTITIKNRNPGAITNTNIEADFPEGTRSAADLTEPYPRYIDTLGTIPAGGTVTRTVQAVFFGSANQQITIPVKFTYQPENSNQVLTKDESSNLTITTSPLTITVTTQGSVASGQPFHVTVAVHSNATTPMNNIAVVAQYPSGFMPQSSASASSTGPLFTLGTLQPGEEKDITINGVLSGTENDKRDFEFTVGTAKGDGTPTLGIAYASAGVATTVTKPFLSTSLALNNSSDDPLVISPTDSVSGAISWVNTLASGITNGQISVQLSGNALNLSGIRATSGYYDSSHSQIIYTKDSDGGLAHLNSGDTGNGSFSIGLKTGAAFTALRSPTVQLVVGVAGIPDGSNSAQVIASSLTRTIKISTDLLLTSYLLHSSGPFVNTGAWPPIANQQTQYTVMLSVTNDVNDVAGAKVKMILPAYVTFTGKTSPSDGSITYDDTTRTVTWSVGDVAAGTIAKPITAAFQISFLPSSAQVNSSPVLIENQTLTGFDRFTKATVGKTADSLTTQTPQDPSFNLTKGSVAN